MNRAKGLLAKPGVRELRRDFAAFTKELRAAVHALSKLAPRRDALEERLNALDRELNPSDDDQVFGRLLHHVEPSDTYRLFTHYVEGDSFIGGLPARLRPRRLASKRRAA